MSKPWRYFIFSSWWLTISFATAHIFKRTETLKLIIIRCWVIGTRSKDQELGLSLQRQTKKRLEMFVVSFTDISPSFILILDKIQEKKVENVLSVICNNVFYDDATNFKVCRFMENTKILISWEQNKILSF